MAGLKYARYVHQNAVKTTLTMPQRIHYPFVHVEKEMWGDLGVNANFACSCVQEPFVMGDIPHAHPYDELLYFLGSDPDNPEKLNAVVEFAIGDEWQKVTFDKTAVLRFPAGLQHAPFYVKKVDRPFFFGHVMQSDSYAKVAVDAPEKVKAKDVKYSDIVKIPEFKKTAYGAASLFNGKAQGVVDMFLNLYFMKKPGVISQPAETKGYDRFSILMGGYPKNIMGFSAEAELSLGKEQETQTITSTTVFHVPAEMPAKPVKFTKVDMMVCFMDIYVPAKK